MLSGTAQVSRATIAFAAFVFIGTTVAAQDSPSPTAASGAGDPRNGLALVQSSKCLDCHRIGEAGSRLGPDLTDIGSRRTVDRLRRALIAPDDEVLPENRLVRVVTPDGTTVTGKLLNQDAFSIQMMTPREELKTYRKGRVRESAIVQNGLMPSYADVLKESDIADVVTYLRTLTGANSAADLSRAGDDTGAARKTTSAFDRILSAEKEPQNWLTYSGGYASQRYSLLHEITRDNVKDLTLKWVWRPRYLDKMESTPLVVDGVLYTVQNSEVVALDAATGRSYWTFRYRVPPESNAYVMVVKGLAFAGDRLFWATYDGHLIAIDAKTGSEIWNQTHPGLETGPAVECRAAGRKGQSDPRSGDQRVRHQLLDCRIRRANGIEVWRFKTVPEPGERGNDTWPGDSWQHGGAPIWVTGSYDPATNLTFWGTGNPNPGWNGGPRNPGDNLYADSVVALDADTGAAEVALPVHAERRVRLGLGAGAGACRHRLERTAAQGDAVGESQRLLSMCSTAPPASSCSAKRS